MPTEFQAAAISSAIERARTHLICARSSIELQAFIESHKAILAPIRRVPNEILAEFFVHCMDVTKPLDPKKGEAWVVSRVCRRWRAVAIACPELWLHFVLPKKPIKHLRDFVRIQLGRAPYPSSLSIRLHKGPQDVMDLFFVAHTQWDEVVLHTNSALAQFARRARNTGTPFPRLKKLEVNDDWSSRLLEGEDRGAYFGLVQSLPALTNLFLDARTELFPKQLVLPWSHLQHCTLWSFVTSDVLWILALLPPSASVIIRGIHDERAFPHSQTASLQASKTWSKISTLEFDNCSRLFTTTLLQVLHVPSLRKLAFRHDRGKSSAATLGEVADFLDRSGCVLEHLRVGGVPLSDAGVLGILDRGHGAMWTNELIRLDVHWITDLRETLEALGRGTAEGSVLLPNLGTLAVRGTSAFESVDVLGLLKSRNPTVRRLPFGRWQWEFPDLPEIGDGLEKELEVVILEDE
ncbi:hypothetical protein FB45DRAFT_1134504 [Roridomyces roridus]|uniref:F-box domain-containing protein n=1 Tax=Roridomyces roridus TaxID=1738132 RepID=A0AAD7C5B8_9AGAR|nr:hypothetical protein FB45DRAFT_1134504 [Roridomyces roridus]